MSELNDRDFDQFGSTLDNENQNLIVSDGILRESDIICVDSLTFIFLGDIERDFLLSLGVYQYHNSLFCCLMFSLDRR